MEKKEVSSTWTGQCEVLFEFKSWCLPLEKGLCRKKIFSLWHRWSECWLVICSHALAQPQETQIANFSTLAGWRLYVTNAPRERLSLEEAVSYYREQWQPERGFHLFKRGRLLSCYHAWK